MFIITFVSSQRSKTPRCYINNNIKERKADKSKENSWHFCSMNDFQLIISALIRKPFY